jgi:uncharacterized protein
MSREPTTKGPLYALPAFITHSPWIALLLGLLMVAGIGVGMGRIQPNFTHTAFFEKDDPELLEFDRFERRFGNDDAVIVVVHSPSGIFDAESAALLRELTERMWQVTEVIRVDSLANFQWVHAQGDDIEIEPLLPSEGELTPELLAERKRIALAHELLPGYLISDDATAAVVYARIKPGIDAPPNSQKITEDTRQLLAELKRGDHAFYVTGGPIMNDAFRESSERDLSKLVPALLGVVALLLIGIFRRIGGVVMSFAVIITTVIAALAMSGWLGIEMSSVTFTLPQILIAVCVADAVHLLVGFYRARTAGLGRRDAAHHTLTKNLVPTLLTSVTTALGFFSFATADLPPIAGLGALAGIGTILAWVVSYLVAGPMMVLWPGKEPAAGERNAADSLRRATPRTTAYVAFVDRHRRSIVLGFATATVVLGYLGTQNAINSNPYEYFKKGLPIRDAQDFILDKLSGVASFELVVDSGREDGIKDPDFMKRVERFEAQAMELGDISRAVSLVDILRQMNRALNGGGDEHYALPETGEGIAQELLLYTMGLPQGMDVNDRVTIKNDALRVTLVSTIVDSSRFTKTTERLEAMGKELGLQVKVTGKMALYQNMNGHVVRSFLVSLVLAIGLIGMVMLASFRSLKLGAISAIPNVVPLLFGGGALFLISGRLDMGSVMVASVCLGLAVDNTIHIMTNYNRHVAEGASAPEAIAQLLAHAGPAMATTTVVLVSGFGTLAFGTFIPNVYFGLLTAIILSVGFLTDMVLLPALLLILSDRSATRERVEPRPGVALPKASAAAE